MAEYVETCQGRNWLAWGVMGLSRLQWHRAYLICDLLRQGRHPNCRTLAERLEVHERTVHRDLTYLRDLLQAPIAYDARRRGYHLIEPGWSMPPVRLAEGEAVALLLGLSALAAYRGTGLEGPLRSLIDKLPLLLPDHVSVDPGDLVADVSFMVEPPRGDQERVAAAFAALRVAIEASHRVEMTYYTPSRDEVTVRRVDPYHLRHFEGAWYLVGFCHLRGAYRTFALDRIQQLAVLDETFSRRGDFSPETYFGESWRLERGAEKQRVVIRFDPYQARWVRGRTWHPTQETVEEPDGSLTLAFTVTGLGEVQRWVLQFGAHAEVLAPPELREAVAAEVVRLIDIYGRLEDAPPGRCRVPNESKGQGVLGQIISV